MIKNVKLLRLLVRALGSSLSASDHGLHFSVTAYKFVHPGLGIFSLSDTHSANTHYTPIPRTCVLSEFIVLILASLA